jgi:hypothetical protein
MNARQRAARVAADVHRSGAVADLARRQVIFSDLKVVVKDGWVRKYGGRSAVLGPLKGACAGIMDVRPLTASEYYTTRIGLTSPRVGTIFAAFADGTRHETPLLMGSRDEMHRIDTAIARFNAMADAAESRPSPAAQPTPRKKKSLFPLFGPGQDHTSDSPTVTAEARLMEGTFLRTAVSALVGGPSLEGCDYQVCEQVRLPRRL